MRNGDPADLCALATRNQQKELTSWPGGSHNLLLGAVGRAYLGSIEPADWPKNM